jgi:glycerate 2-kinase
LGLELHSDFWFRISGFPMNVLIAPDKFKGCLTATQVAKSIGDGIHSVDPKIQIDFCPIADGGEGTVAALVTATNGCFITHRVTGPLPDMKVDATFGFLGDTTTAVIEMSAASGLALLPPPDRNPLNTTTFGAGELIAAAVRQGARKIILGIGGSATNDAGIGCAQACGFTVLLRDGQPASLTDPLCSRDLDNILMVKHGRGEITNGIDIAVACDVTNPLFGPGGAAPVFAPQKGATPQIVEQLDRSLRSLAERTGKQTEANTPGAGAAGGLGFGMLAFFGATLTSGFDLIADAIHLRRRLSGVDLCFTGEGQLDAQSAHGKAVTGLSRMCRAADVPCIALVGAIGPDAQHSLAEGLTAYFSITNSPMTFETACGQAPRLLAEAAANCLRLWNAKGGTLPP